MYSYFASLRVVGCCLNFNTHHLLLSITLNETVARETVVRSKKKSLKILKERHYVSKRIIIHITPTHTHGFSKSSEILSSEI